MKWIKRFLENIKRLTLRIKQKYYKLKNKYVNNNKNEVGQDLKKETVHLDECALEKENKKCDEYSKLAVWDVIWSKRYTTEEEKKNMPEGHREGSFILVKKENDRWYGLYGTSKENNKYTSWKYQIKDNKGNVKKNIYYRINDLYEINFDMFDNKIRSLKECEYCELANLLKMHGKIYPVIYKDHQYIKLDCISDFVKVGDIVSTGINQLVISKEQGKLRCLRFDKAIPEIKNGITFKDLEYINYSSSIMLDVKKADFRVIGNINDEYLKIIFQKRKEYLEKQKFVQRGSIIMKDDKLYYVYGEEGQDFMTYQIEKKYKENFVKININAKAYYTNFEQKLNINRKAVFRVIDLATDEETEKIRDIKKNYLKQKKSNQTRNNNKILINEKTMRFGTGFKLKKNKHDTFVAISCYKGKVTYISEENLNNMINFQSCSSIDSVREITSLNDPKMLENKTKLKKLLSRYNRD